MRPVINSKAITKIQKDKQITVLEIRNNWVYVNVEGINGWAKLSTLKKEDNTTTSAENKGA